MYFCFSDISALKIHISPSTKAALENFPEFIVEERGEVSIKVGYSGETIISILAPISDDYRKLPWPHVQRIVSNLAAISDDYMYRYINYACAKLTKTCCVWPFNRGQLPLLADTYVLKEWVLYILL